MIYDTEILNDLLGG